jgi:hypothetical protein
MVEPVESQPPVGTRGTPLRCSTAPATMLLTSHDPGWWAARGWDARVRSSTLGPSCFEPLATGTRRSPRLPPL